MVEDLVELTNMDETPTNNKKRKKKKKGSCYQCGQLDHRAKDCPNITTNASSYLQFAKREAPPDLGQFAASSSATTNTTTTNDGFSYIELFAGVGGFRLALDRLGGRCVFASEVDRFCIKNYQINFGDRPAGDINRISSNSIPNHDLLVGGFPCQPFSSSGSKAGLADTERGVLFKEITRILKDKQPKGFLLENVRGLLLHDDGHTFTIIRTELEECGYTVCYELVDAVNLLPQERKRLYIVGIRNDLDCKYTFPSMPNLGRGVNDIIQQHELSEEEIESLNLTPHQLNKVESQSYTQKYPESRFLCDLSLPSKTIQSSYSSYMVGSQFIPVLPNNSISMPESKVSHNDEGIKWRRFSHREVARLQGFPETFHLCSQRAYHQLGNAVAPPVIAMLAAPLLQTLGLAKNNDTDDWGWKVSRELLIEASPNDSRRIELKKNLV